MGLISKVLSFTRVLRNGGNLSDVKADPGGGANTTMEHFSAPGDDSFPLETDYAVSVPVPGRGRQAVVGYVDPVSTPKSLKGDKRIYARDASGALVVELWLHNDGAGELSNALGSLTLLADGTFNINGVLISAAGTITDANGIVLGTHTHPQAPDSDGDTQQPTGVPIP